MVMVDGSKKERRETSKSVRLDDRLGFDHKFNKTGFKCDTQKNFYYYLVKCYEQVLRGFDASAVSKKRNDFVVFAQKHELKPLPVAFRSLTDAQKVETLTKLLEEQLEQCQVNGLGKVEVDDGSFAEVGPEYSINEADLGPEHSINEASSLRGDFVQSDPPGRPCTRLRVKFHEFVSELERTASGGSDIMLEIENCKQICMQLMTKVEDRDICGSLGLDSSNTLMRKRQEELLAQLQEDIMDPPNHRGKPSVEGVGLHASYSQASNSRSAEIFASTQMHVKQDPSVASFPTAPPLIAHRDPSISEALNVTPSYTGRLKANLKEIPPQVAGDLQYQFDKPMMKAFGHPSSYPLANELLGSQQVCRGEYLTTMPYSGGRSGSQMMFPTGDLIPSEPSPLEQTTPELCGEKLLDHQAPLEGLVWSHLWTPPMHYEL